MGGSERISDAQVGRCSWCGEITLAAPDEDEIVCSECANDDEEIFPAGGLP